MTKGKGKGKEALAKDKTKEIADEDDRYGSFHHQAVSPNVEDDAAELVEEENPTAHVSKSLQPREMKANWNPFEELAFRRYGIPAGVHCVAHFKPGADGRTCGPNGVKKEEGDVLSSTSTNLAGTGRAAQRAAQHEAIRSEKSLIRTNVIKETSENELCSINFTNDLQARRDRINNLKMLIDLEDSPASKRACVENLKAELKKQEPVLKPRVPQIVPSVVVLSTPAQRRGVSLGVRIPMQSLGGSSSSNSGGETQTRSRDGATEITEEVGNSDVYSIDEIAAVVFSNNTSI